MHYLLRYQYVDEIDTLREPFRAEHLRRLWHAADQGDVLVAGGVGDPVTEAVIVWDVDDPRVIDEFAQADPYMTAGLITAHDVVPWRTVAGPFAATPVRP